MEAEDRQRVIRLDGDRTRLAQGIYAPPLLLTTPPGRPGAQPVHARPLRRQCWTMGPLTGPSNGSLSGPSGPPRSLAGINSNVPLR